MSLKNLIFLVFLFFISFSFSQTIKGVVLDAKTQLPIETATVYFDNTTIGTVTNQLGEFSLEYNEAIKSSLIVSFLGYKKVIINSYNSNTKLKILLDEDISNLDEIVISANDGMPRRIKLQQFRKQFLGTSKNGKSCKILNESDLILRYNKQENKLYASAKQPVIIVNKNLKYKITFDIVDFEIAYRYVDIKRQEFNIKSVVYTGTSFYKTTEKPNESKDIKKRQKAYKGSVLHFMRSLYNEQLSDEEYQIFNKGFIVADSYIYGLMSKVVDTNLKKVQLKNSISILFHKKKQSELTVVVSEFYIDNYGNYTPIAGVLFNGEMGNQRIGDSLPFDYKLSD
jgi:hypothetical protein